jgi:CO/xanthine dehydrogenase Mo-binding subunit
MTRAVGARQQRYDGLAHVTGQSRYVDDYTVPGMLWCKALRSPVDSALITRLDTTSAAELPGVHAVITHTDVPRNIVGALEDTGVPPDEPLLAEHEVRWQGQPVAAVAAESEAIADYAVGLIELELQERSPLLDIRKGLDPDAPQVSPQGNAFLFDPYYQRRVRRGDVEATMQQADVIVKGVYRSTPIEHAPTETQAALVIPESDGRFTVHSITQAMYFTMGIFAKHLGVPLGKVKFVGGTVGGGFGGKIDSQVEPICAVLATKARRPVKWRFTRQEEFLCTSTRAGWHIEITDAVSSEGWILGRRALSLHDAGAYTRFSSYGTGKHAFHLSGPYTVPNVAFDAYAIYTNRAPSSAMRGFGVTAASFATEMQMSRVAAVLGMDPWELRLRHANRIGDLGPTRVRLEDPSTVPTIQAVASAVGYELTPEYRQMTSDRDDTGVLAGAPQEASS